MSTPWQSQARFQERAELLDFLLEVAAVTSETLDLDSLLTAVAEIVNRVVPHDLFAILLYSERRQGLLIRYARGHRDEVVKNLVVPLGEGITGAAGATLSPVVVNDVRSDSRYLNAMDAVRSELAVPMTARGKLVGVIDVQSTYPDAFSDQDCALLQLVASRVSAAIDNARLYRRVERQNRTLRMLSRASQEFSSIMALDQLLSKIARSVRTLINYDAFSILLVDERRGVLKNCFSERYDERVEVDNVPLGRGLTGAAAESLEPIRVDDTLTDPRYIASHPDIRSEVAVPLVAKEKVIGVMDLESDRVGFFTDEHVRMLSMLAPQIAISIENARLYEELAHREQRMEQDLKAARKLQSVLLPRKAPELEGVRIAIGSKAAHEITGDLYDFCEHGEDYALIACGDSSGKGAAAALYGAMVTGLLRSIAPRRRSPSLLMRSLNEVLLERKVDAQYVTLLLLSWQARTGVFTMANAGGLPPVICRRGAILSPKVEGVPLGLLEDREYEDVVFQAEIGDVLLVVSDGVPDQQNPEGEEYGRRRLSAFLKRNYRRSPEQIVEVLSEEIRNYRQDAPVNDDQTIIAIQVT
ncbi:MAG: GAF domain-containing protein [Bryobacteraceae bacterium]